MEYINNGVINGLENAHPEAASLVLTIFTWIFPKRTFSQLALNNVGILWG